MIQGHYLQPHLLLCGLVLHRPRQVPSVAWRLGTPVLEGVVKALSGAGVSPEGSVVDGSTSKLPGNCWRNPGSSSGFRLKSSVPRRLLAGGHPALFPRRGPPHCDGFARASRRDLAERAR